MYLHVQSEIKIHNDTAGISCRRGILHWRMALKRSSIGGSLWAGMCFQDLISRVTRHASQYTLCYSKAVMVTVPTAMVTVAEGDEGNGRERR